MSFLFAKNMKKGEENEVKVEMVLTKDGKTRYILLNNKGELVEPVIKFLKFKDNSGSARETLRAYCHHLKLYFEFLEQKGLLYYDLGIDEMAEFMRWLQNPHASVKVFSISPRAPMRKPCSGKGSPARSTPCQRGLTPQRFDKSCRVELFVNA